MEIQEALEKYEPVIGIEIHAQLRTKSKAYCGDLNEYGHIPNSLTSAVSLGHPGTLPKFNEEVLNHAIKLGLANPNLIAWFSTSSLNFGKVPG